MALRFLTVRFKVGDWVEILGTIPGDFIGMTGIVTEVLENVQTRTLDEYRVQLEDCEETFWDVQLRRKPLPASLEA